MDFTFYSERRGAEGLILELKVDGSPEEAIQQIKDRKTKEHSCKIEEIQ